VFEALLTFLRAQKPPIPGGGFGVGPIFKKDVIQASTMLEKKRAFATILAFDVKIDPEAAQMADDMGVRVFTYNIIYHLQDQFQQYLQDLRQSARDNSKPVFPCVLQILDQFIFNKKNPIVVGVKVLEGIVKSGTPLCVIKEDSAGTRSVLTIGTIGSLQLNNKPVQSARSPEEICIKIDQNQAENFIMYGRQFDHKHKLFSVISRASIDALKANFREDLKEPEDTMLIVKLKKMFNII
jgi:translation initiation factor 5B